MLFQVKKKPYLGGGDEERERERVEEEEK